MVRAQLSELNSVQESEPATGGVSRRRRAPPSLGAPRQTLQSLGIEIRDKIDDPITNYQRKCNLSNIAMKHPLLIASNRFELLLNRANCSKKEIVMGAVHETRRANVLTLVVYRERN